MKKLLLILGFLCISLMLTAQPDKVMLDKSNSGIKLMVNGKVQMVNGMNWDYFPIGTNYSYSLWDQSDDFIKRALDDEMSLLKNMGVNTIRVYTGIQPRWIKYIYENYGIRTMLNHSFGRYGLTLDGVWVANTEYSDARVKELLIKEVTEVAKMYKDVPGVLLYLLGNENNYGLFWDGAETEDIPMEDRVTTHRAQHLYKLFNEATLAMKAIDQNHPVSICNGDLLFLDIIARECKDVDILGVNSYRGKSFTDLFERVHKEFGKPVLMTEFGSDAFNAITNEEDQKSQAVINTANWREIYENAAGPGKFGNSLGGFTFQFSDGWWKTGQTKNLDVHDSQASWSNGGYLFDYTAGVNNMNEEWFGICAKGPVDEMGLYRLYPRAAYYSLKEAHKLNPYADGVTLKTIDDHFSSIGMTDALLKARGDKAALEVDRVSKIRLSRLTAEFSTFYTGGSLITTPDKPVENSTTFPDQLGFDHMESFYLGVEANPTTNFTANVEFNILGHVAKNPIDQIFYENRGREVSVQGNTGDLSVESLNRVEVYRASYQWNHKWFNMNGFYRTGHYHWGYEGDFFGLYPEANYGPNIDIYNGIAPFGFEIEGKQAFKGLKLAFGPQLWWGANAAFLIKYSRDFGKFNVTGIYHQDIDQLDATETSFAIPQPQTRRVTLQVKRKFGKFGIDLGGIWAGQPLNGREFQVVRGEEGNYSVYQAEIGSRDNFGGKIKLTVTGGRVNWYAQSAMMGLVAQGGADYTVTFTGWRLKDSGSGNQMNFLTGFTVGAGKFQIAPNFLWQKPIEGPIPMTVPEPGRPRNILDDPFVVRSNREQVSGELQITYDPTPGTWMYDWDNDRAEDAGFAVSAGLVYRHLPTTQDAAIGILPDGRTTFAFPGAPPAHDLWEAYARIVSKMTKDFGLIANLYAGDAQANGSDDRLIKRMGLEMKMIYKKSSLNTFVKVNDWGPYDYHRDFNLTFPLQLMADLSTGLSKPSWLLLPSTRIGIRATYRTLDQYSPRYAPTYKPGPGGVMIPDPEAIGFDNGTEWELRTYVQINIGK